MIPLTVTAVMGSAPLVKEPLRLDAVLYYAIGRRLGRDAPAGYADKADVDVVPLPLARVETPAGWWYAASQATPWGSEEPVYTHKRAPLQQALIWTSQKGVNIAAGADKSLRKRAYTRPEMSVITWTCVGDPVEVASLLELVPGLGAQVTQGYGWVREWHIAPGGPSLEAYATDIELRHIPVTLLDRLPMGATTTRDLPLRPPYWSRDNLVTCVLRPYVEVA